MLASALLGQDPPELPVAQLVRLAALFAMSENRVRVALTRMVASGEATTDGHGSYRLAGHLLERQQRQQASRAGRTRPWTGEWTMVVVVTTGSAAEVRGDRRRALAFARLAELRDGFWLRPDNLEVTLPGEVEGDVVRLRGRPEDDRVLAGQLWPLAAWAERAEELAGRLAERPPGTGPTWHPGSSCRRQSCGTSRPTPCCRPRCCPRGGPATACGPTTTAGTPATGRYWPAGAARTDPSVRARGPAGRPGWSSGRLWPACDREIPRSEIPGHGVLYVIAEFM